jgi:alpha-galactosidase
VATVALVASLATPTAAAAPAGQAAPAATPAATTGSINGLAQTPYLGWNTYYGLGSAFNEQTIKSVADSMVTSGLKAAGYQYVWIDGGWWPGTRDAGGNITVSATQWPDGMRAVADYIHSKGLKAGIYTDAGTNGCGGAHQGSYGHYQQDVNQFAAWGYDAVKVDFCGGTQQQLDPATAYGQFRDALLHNSSNRPMLFNICNPFQPGEYSPGYPPYDRSVYNSYSFGPTTGNSWRTDTDIGFVHSVQFSDVLRNLDADAAHPEAAGPGHWNDPDYLGPELGMTSAEAQSQFSMWSMVAAPLIVGSDIRSLSPQTLAMLTNPEVLAVDQDPLGAQGTAIATTGDAQVWVKRLANGDRAVALLNRGTTPLTISTDAGAVGMPNASSYQLRDLWQHTSTETAGRIAANVAPHSTVLYRVSVLQDPQSLPPAVVVSSPDTPAAYPGSQLRLAIPGQSMPVSATFENDGLTPVQNVNLTLTGPAGWQIQPQPTINEGTVPTGRRITATWTVTPAAGALPGSDTLKVASSYSWDGPSAGTASPTTQTSVTVPAPPPSGSASLSNQTWLDGTSGYLVPRLDREVGGGPLVLQGHTYPQGIGTASVSQIQYFLGGNCTNLSTTIGIDDVVNKVGPQGGTAVFQIYADGQKIYDSGVVTRQATQQVSVPVTGAGVLTLAVGDGGDGTYNDRADWAGLQVTCGPPVATVPSGPWPHFVPNADETASATSANGGYPPANAIDGQLTTIWHSEFSPVHTPLPISFTVDLGTARTVDGITYQPRLDGTATGTITGYTVSLSTDGTTYIPAATGSWAPDSSIKSAQFAPATARFVRLTATAAVNGYASAAEIGVSDIPPS